jgi:hypothetical protein
MRKIITLQRWRVAVAWSNAPSPSQLQALINSVAAGYGLRLYVPIYKLTLARVAHTAVLLSNGRPSVRIRSSVPGSAGV